MSVGKLALGADGPVRAASGDPLRVLAERLPRPIRFLGVDALVLTAFACLPQAALFIGTVAGALVGHCGHRLFAFAPKGTR